MWYRADDLGPIRQRHEPGDCDPPFGARIHSPWALAIESRLGSAAGFEVQTVWSDDGIALRFADADDFPDPALLIPDPEDEEDVRKPSIRTTEAYCRAVCGWIGGPRSTSSSSATSST